MTEAALLRRAALAVRGAALRAGMALPAVCQAHGEVQAANWQRVRRLGRCQSRASQTEPLVRALGRRHSATEQLEMAWGDPKKLLTWLSNYCEGRCVGYARHCHCAVVLCNNACGLACQAVV
jgi:hypothetical protein